MANDKYDEVAEKIRVLYLRKSTLSREDDIESKATAAILREFFPHAEMLWRCVKCGEVTTRGKAEASGELADGVPCGHPGCLSHISHPCEGCGRIGGRRFATSEELAKRWARSITDDLNRACEKAGELLNGQMRNIIKQGLIRMLTSRPSPTTESDDLVWALFDAAITWMSSGLIQPSQAQRDSLMGALKARAAAYRLMNSPAPTAEMAREQEEPDFVPRWQEAIYKLVCKRTRSDAIDGKGCDSGDPLDFTLSEINQGFDIFIDKLDEAEAAEKALREAQIFRAATNAIYFDDSSDYLSTLYEIVEILKPGYAPERMPFLETDEQAAALLAHEAQEGEHA